MAENKLQTAKKDNRRYKYGSLSVIFTVAFIALIIVINAVFSSLSLSGDLTVDLTAEDFTSLGEETHRLLGELGKDLDITIYFMAARDAYDSSDSSYKGVNLLSLIRDLAENYAREYDGSGDRGTIRVEYKEINTDPEFEAKVLQESTQALSASSIIVKGPYHYRVLNIQAFFEVDSNNDYYSFNGEYRFTTAILQSSIAEPQMIAFTTGHGEPSALPLKALYAGAGFECVDINLSEENIDPRTCLVVCYDPQTDFSYAEIDKVTSYLNGYKSFAAFVDAETPELPALQACLNDGWGINYNPLYRITDKTHSFDGDYDNISAKYPDIDEETSKSMASYQIFKTVADMGGLFTTSLPECVELTVKPTITKDNFIVEKVLTTYSTAESANTSGETGSKGEIPTMLLSTRGAYGDNNVPLYAYVMLVGSTDFASLGNLAAQRGNSRILLAAARVFGSELMAPNISSKPFGSSALDIETGAATTLTWLICTIVPGVVLILGIVMFFRRRHL